MATETPRHRGEAKRGRSRGFTLAELIIGLVVTSGVLLALGSFAVAVSAGWKHSNQTHAVNTTADRASVQLDQVIRNVMAVVQQGAPTATNASSYLFYWRNDGFGGTADSQAAVGEMGLLEYDPVLKTIWMYETIPEAQMSTLQRLEAQQTNWGSLSSPLVVSYFKGRSYLAPRRAVVGPGTDAASTSARVKSGAFACVTPTDGRPLVNYDFSLEAAGAGSGGQPVTTKLFGSVTLRNPQTPLNAN